MIQYKISYTHPLSWRDSPRVDNRLMIGSELNTFFSAPGVDTPRVDTDPSEKHLKLVKKTISYPLIEKLLSCKLD